MNNVAVNLVATMMQNNFSGKNNTSSTTQYLSHSNFSSILKQNQSSSYSSNMKKLPTTLDEQFESSRQKLKIQERTSNEGKQLDRYQVNSNSKIRENEPVNREKLANDKVEGNESLVSKNPTSKDLESLEKNELTSTDQVKDTTVDEDRKMQEKELMDDISEQLGITPEEMQEVLNQLQLTVFDLFDTSHLQQFMMEALNITNPMELLVTDGALQKLQEVATTLTDTSLSKPEISKLLQQMRQNEAGVASNVEESLGDDKKIITEVLRNFQASTQSNMSNQSNNSQTSGENVALTSLENKPAGSNGLSVSTTFEGILTQVVTQKTETIVMNGTIATIYKEVTAKDVLDQVVTGMKMQVKDGKSDIVMQLQPENLGKIALRLTHENGLISGEFVAETELVKEIIEANLNQLKSQLQNQGLQIHELKIIVGNSTSYFAGGQEKSHQDQDQETKKSQRRNGIGNISSSFADTIHEEDLRESQNFIRDNSSIELKA